VQCGRTTVIELIGELDVSREDRLVRLTEDVCGRSPASGEVVLDLRGFTFADLHGIQAVLDASSRLRGAGYLLSCRGLQPSVHGVADLAGLSLSSAGPP
jgi:anti-anti-sigma factor